MNIVVSADVQRAEELCKTVLAAFPESDMAREYEKLAQQVLRACGREDA